MLGEPLSFFIDYSNNSAFISSYQNFDGKKKLLINVNKESGL